MKMKKMLSFALVAGALTFAVACDKDDDKPATTLSKIQANWKVSSILIESGDADSTYTGTAADYIDFRTDGKVYTNLAGEKDTSAYSLPSDTRLVIDGDTTDIKQLSSSQFVFMAKEAILTDTIKTTFTLNK